MIEQLYALVNERYESQRSLVVTTNLDQGELEEQIGARVVSRLVEMCGDPLPLFDDDRRLRVSAEVAGSLGESSPAASSAAAPGWALSTTEPTCASTACAPSARDPHNPRSCPE